MSNQHNPTARRELDWDVGGASERTVFSWQRTAISSLAVAALGLRTGIVDGLLGLAIPIAVLMTAAAIGEYWFSTRIYHEHDRPFAHGAAVHSRALPAIAAATVIAAVGSAVLAVNA